MINIEKELIQAAHADNFLEVVYQQSKKGKECRTQMISLLSKIHNKGAVNVIAQFRQLKLNESVLQL